MRRIYDSSGSVGQVTIRSMKNAAIIIQGTSRVRTVANTLASGENILQKDSPPFGEGSGGVEMTQPETYSPQRFTGLDGGQVARTEAGPLVMAMEADGGRVAKMEARPPVMATEADGGRVARMEARPPVMATKANGGQAAKMEARPPVMATVANGGRVAKMEARPRASPINLIHKGENAPVAWI